MQYSKTIFKQIFFSGIALSILFSCEAQKEKKHKKEKHESSSANQHQAI